MTTTLPSGAPSEPLNLTALIVRRAVNWRNARDKGFATQEAARQALENAVNAYLTQPEARDNA